MNNNQLIDWLKENGGPVIKLNLLKESLVDKDLFDANDLAHEILQNEKVLNVLSFFNQFENFKSKGEPYSLIHGCYENYFEVFMPIFINMGFHAGIHAFDEKIELMKEVYTFAADYDMQQGVMPFTSIIVMLYLLKAGYYNKDIEQYTLQRLNNLHKIAIFHL